MKRALRRHHKFRMTRKAERSDYVAYLDKEERWSLARKVADHLKVCSCEFGCGNPRNNPWSCHRASLTKQERLSDVYFREMLSDWDLLMASVEEQSASDHT